jgi:hypothetical protein
MKRVEGKGYRWWGIVWLGEPMATASEFILEKAGREVKEFIQMKHGENQNCSTCGGWRNVTIMCVCRERRWHVEGQSLLLFPFTFSKLSFLTEIQNTVACECH